MSNKNNNSFKYIFYFLVAVIALIILGLGIYIFRPETGGSELKTNVSLNSFQLASNLNYQLKQDYPSLSDTSANNQISRGFPLKGYNFRVLLPQTYGSFSIDDSSVTSETDQFNSLTAKVPNIDRFMAKNGFTKLAQTKQDASLLSSIYYYQRSDIACQLTLYTQMVFTCAPLAALNDTASSAAQLVSVYTANVVSPGDNSISSADTRQSATSGYTISTLPIYNNYGETKANFYRIGSGDWRLVDLKWYNDPHENGNPTPNCADFESVNAVRLAFLSLPCYDSVTMNMSVIK